MLEESSELVLDRKRRPKVFLDNSITPWDVDNTMAMEIERKHRQQAKMEMMRRRYRNKDANHMFERQPSISKINDFSVDVLEGRSSHRYQPYEEEEDNTIESSLLGKSQNGRSVLRLPGLRLPTVQRSMKSPQGIVLQGRRCRSNNSYVSPYQSLDVINEVLRRRNEPPPDLVPTRFEYERLSRKNSLFRWMRERKESILSNVYEQIKKL